MSERTRSTALWLSGMTGGWALVAIMMLAAGQHETPLFMTVSLVLLVNGIVSLAVMIATGRNVARPS